jgi:methionine-rich copper-binding protein CopC
MIARRFAVLAALPVLAGATAALAHAHVVSSTPAANASGPAPKTLHLEFSEGLEAKFSGVELMKASGPVVAADSKVSGKAIDATPKAPLAPGEYMVMWHALSSDGHKSNGSYNFTVK